MNSINNRLKNQIINRQNEDQTIEKSQLSIRKKIGKDIPMEFKFLTSIVNECDAILREKNPRELDKK